MGDLGADERGAAKRRLQSYKVQLSEAQSKLKRSAVALSGGAAARDELFAFDGTSDDSVRDAAADFLFFLSFPLTECSHGFTSSS